MAYVPPHLRNKRSSAAESEVGPKAPEPRLGERQTRTTSSSPIYSVDDVAGFLGCPRSSISTLTVAKSPSSEGLKQLERSQESEDDVLRAIILFSGQHPEWRSEHKILCKSNLHVLHKLAGPQLDQTDQTSPRSFTIDESGAEYPLFQEFPFMKNKFDFAGWWRIQNITFLAPGSAELVALFEKKFSVQDKRGHSTFSSSRNKPKARTEEAWRDSLRREWAVVTLVQNHARKDLPKVPPKVHSNAGNELQKDSMTETPS